MTRRADVGSLVELAAESLAAGSPVSVLAGLLAFALLSALGIAVGWGVLSLVRLPADPPRRLLLAPFVATALWALAGNLLVRLGLTMAVATAVIGAVSLGVAAFAVGSAARLRRGSGLAALVVGSALVVGLVAWPYFARGLTVHVGSANPDTAYSTSMATVLWRYGLHGPPTSLPFFERFGPYAQSVAMVRNHAFVLLALFSPLVQPGEPVFVRNLLACWSIFVLACSLGFYALSWTGSSEPASRPWRTPLLYTAVTLGIGWAAVPTLVGNWENGLFVSVGPVLAGLAAEPARGRGYGILLGASLAYGVYTFPEVAPILGLLLLPLFLPAPAGQRRFAGLAIAVVTAVILLAPGADSLRAYMQHQVAAATPAGDAVRPGGDFAGRLATAPLDLAAWWALGTQHRRPPLPEVVLGGLFACGLLLTALAVVGMARLGRQGGWRELSVLGLTGASLGYFVLVDRYGYGAYKILSVTWWLVGRCVVEGCAAAVTVVRTRAPASAAGRVARGLTVAVVGGVLLAGGLVTGAQRLFSYFRAADLPPTLPALDRLRAAAASQPPMDVLVARALADRTTLMWILYALKDTRLRLYHESPVPAGIPGEATWSSDRPVPRAVLLRPRDVRGVTFRFETPEFALVDLESNPFVEVIDSSNEPEPWGTWLGTRPITLALLAPPGLAVTLAFEALPGPSRPDSPRRTIVLHAGAREIGRVQIDGPATVTFPFVAAGGREVLTLSTPDFPTVARLPGGDARTQLVGIRNLTAGRAAAPGVTP